MVLTVGVGQPSPLAALVLLAVQVHVCSLVEDCLRQNWLTVLQVVIHRSRNTSSTVLVLNQALVVVVLAQVDLAALPLLVLLLVLAEAPSPSFPSWMLSLLLLLVELKLTLHRMLVLTWLVELVEPVGQ